MDIASGSRAFHEKKVGDYGGAPKSEAMEWMKGWTRHAPDRDEEVQWTHACFGNPLFCPYGANWGNLVLNRGAIGARVVHLFPHADNEEVVGELQAFNRALNSVDDAGEEKDGGGDARRDEAFRSLSQRGREALSAIREHRGGVQGRCLESRCMVRLDLPASGCTVVSLHLEDRDVGVRAGQVTVALSEVERALSDGRSVLVMGDMNMVHLGAYTSDELDRLRALLPPGADLPSLDARLLSPPLSLRNPHVKHESVFCKNVCHILTAEAGDEGPGPLSNLVTGCVYTDAGDHSMQVAAW